MASRRFFAYDPYDYHHTTPYHYPYPYPYPYYYQQYPSPAPNPARSDNAFFPAAGSAEPAARATARQPKPRSRSVSVPVYFVGSDLEPEVEREELRAPPVARTVAEAAAPAEKRAPSAEEAVVRVQAAARGFLARRMVREVRAVEREAEGVAARVAFEAEALRGDARARVAVGEALMRLLLRLDAVHGAREYRRRVTKRVLALQDAVDALEPKAAAAPAAVEMAEAHAPEEGQMAEANAPEEGQMAEANAPEEGQMAEAHAPEEGQMTEAHAPEEGQMTEAHAPEEGQMTEAPAAVEMAEAHAPEEGQMAEAHAPEEAPAAAEMAEAHAPESPDDAEHGVDMEAKAAVEAPATETAADMEVEGVRGAGERDAENAMDDGGKPEEAEGEWEMVTEESAAACNAEPAEAGEGSAAPEDAEQRHEPLGEEEKKNSEGGAADGLDARKVMEMVAALCERSAQQCAVIGALAERVDELERTVRRVEEADRRRRRNKKLKKDGYKGSRKCTARSCYSD